MGDEIEDPVFTVLDVPGGACTDVGLEVASEEVVLLVVPGLVSVDEDWLINELEADTGALDEKLLLIDEVLAAGVLI